MGIEEDMKIIKSYLDQQYDSLKRLSRDYEEKQLRCENLERAWWAATEKKLSGSADNGKLKQSVEDIKNQLRLEREYAFELQKLMREKKESILTMEEKLSCEAGCDGKRLKPLSAKAANGTSANTASTRSLTPSQSLIISNTQENDALWGQDAVCSGAGKISAVINEPAETPEYQRANEAYIIMGGVPHKDKLKAAYIGAMQDCCKKEYTDINFNEKARRVCRDVGLDEKYTPAICESLRASRVVVDYNCLDVSRLDYDEQFNASMLSGNWWGGLNKDVNDDKKHLDAIGIKRFRAISKDNIDDLKEKLGKLSLDEIAFKQKIYDAKFNVAHCTTGAAFEAMQGVGKGVITIRSTMDLVKDGKRPATNNSSYGDGGGDIAQLGGGDIVCFSLEVGEGKKQSTFASLLNGVKISVPWSNLQEEYASLSLVDLKFLHRTAKRGGGSVLYRKLEAELGLSDAAKKRMEDTKRDEQIVSRKDMLSLYFFGQDMKEGLALSLIRYAREKFLGKNSLVEDYQKFLACSDINAMVNGIYRPEVKVPGRITLTEGQYTTSRAKNIE